MKLKVNNLQVIIKDKELNIKEIVMEKFRFKESELLDIIVVKKSIDARRENVKMIYSLIIEVLDYTVKRLIQYKEISSYLEEDAEINYIDYKGLPPLIIGFGPAGIFSALYLARCKANPIVIERGGSIEKRNQDVKDFLFNKTLNPNSNIVYGEGGAGTFSDGKLTTNINDKLNKFILNEFVKHGAPKEILYDSMPHIGTDILEKVIKSIREEIINLGGKVYFDTLFYKFEKQDDIIDVYVKNQKEEIFKTNTLILALGHSAYDTIKYLHEVGLNMEAKAFSMGVRIEHTQKYINKLQHKDYYDLLPPATYKLAVHLKDRSLYTFCMCPGGEVVPSSNDPNSIVTNGMSRYKRDAVNSNSALLVNVFPSDYYKDNVLDGFLFQKKYERLAFEVSNDYKAPCNLVKEFLKGEVATSIRSVKPSYPHGVKLCDLRLCLPDFVYQTLKEGLKLMDKKIPGFAYNDAVLIGIESRSSSPVRILRDESLNSNVSGIYPIGEGAGYAGGIMSAALDGLKTAMAITKEK